MKKNQDNGMYYFYSDQDKIDENLEKEGERKINFGLKDIVAMIIAAFELVFPPIFMIFGVVLVIYLVLKFISGF